MRRSRLSVAALAIAVSVAGLSATRAEAAPAPPGGRILTLAVTAERGSGELRSVRPDGSGAYAYSLRLSWWAGPDYSPDGSRIAYADWMEVWAMNADGTNAQNLVGGPCAPESPRWSPDARWIAFESCGDIYKVSAKGYASGFVNLTNDDLYTLRAAWSPLGARIATAGPSGVYLYRADGTGAPRRVSDLPDATRLDWSPDGRTLAVAAGDDLWTVDLPTGARRRMTDTPGVIERHPVWSPDGRWLAFSRGPEDPNDPGVALTPEVWLTTAAGTHSHSTGVLGIPTSWRFQP
ncbi:PD40 domain-containing protein [Paractinoplanes atraurantiacus]|uniref:TolB protein n=1 Tax=Paractinoplanes atraurantiacus TaxID=1036182 RepID=A0A285JG41_9ACTN|nr:PD40 domain-containing protein [Actinoplanes atraurantiacus]SNY59270.1 TolB protein [Actinoplanes atraurantiacus]